MTLADRIDAILESGSIRPDALRAWLGGLRAEPRVAIHGAGHWGRWLHGVLAAQGVAVECFLDRNALRLGAVDGLPVHTPDGAPHGQADREALRVVVAAHYLHHPAIRETLARRGYARVDVPRSLWYGGPHDRSTDVESLTDWRPYREASGLFADDKSARIYADAVESYVAGVCRMTTAPETDNQYFPEDVPDGRGYARFVDCGAYDGDTLLALRANRGPVESIVAFESDPESFAALAGRVRGDGSAFASSVLLYPCGVWRATEALPFAGGQGVGSGIDESGGARVQCVALDDALAGYDPSCIKMDIEGAETAALDGAREVVERARPDLAICVYHSIVDLCRIPLRIHRWNLGYRFFLRGHRPCNQEIVLYARRAGR